MYHNDKRLRSWTPLCKTKAGKRGDTKVALTTSPAMEHRGKDKRDKAAVKADKICKIVDVNECECVCECIECPSEMARVSFRHPEALLLHCASHCFSGSV